MDSDNHVGEAGSFNEDFYEQAIIEHMVDKLGYEHLYGPDVRRTDSVLKVFPTKSRKVVFLMSLE